MDSKRLVLSGQEIVDWIEVKQLLKPVHYT